MLAYEAVWIQSFLVLLKELRTQSLGEVNLTGAGLVNRENVAKIHHINVFISLHIVKVVSSQPLVHVSLQLIVPESPVQLTEPGQVHVARAYFGIPFKTVLLDAGFLTDFL